VANLSLLENDLWPLGHRTRVIIIVIIIIIIIQIFIRCKLSLLEVESDETLGQFSTIQVSCIIQFGSSESSNGGMHDTGTF